MAASISDASFPNAVHAGPWWRHRGVLHLNFYLFVPLITGCINGYNSSLVNGLQILPAWRQQFLNPHGKTLGIITSAQVIGSLVGLPMAPYCSDRFGRRATLLVGAILMLGGVALQAIEPTVVRFVVARTLVGVGLIFGTIAAPLLITELAYPTQRDKFTSLYNTMWYVGSIVAAWTCLVAYDSASNPTWSWRAPILGQALGPLLQIFLIWFVPESPRWLISKGSESKALRILARFHAIGFNKNDPFVQYEVAQIQSALRMEQKNKKNALFATLFATSGNKKRMRIVLGIAFFSQWSGNGLLSHYINLVLENINITNTRTKATINGFLQIWNLVAAVTGALLIDKVGRRTLFLVSSAGMLTSFSVWSLTMSLFHTNSITVAANVTIPFIFVFYLFYNVAYTPMLVAYTLEILPFAIRAKGFALMNLTVSLSQAFNQFVDPWALDAIGWKYYLVYCAWLFFELVFVVLFIVETRGRTLEDTAALFDSEDKPEPLAQMSREAAVIAIRRTSTSDDEQPEDDVDDDFLYPGKEHGLESYELRRPQLVLERDRVGHTRSKVVVLSFDKRV
ncbi:general substrate transporter [Russula emetica]|nr:general substrate transporter [Russula emetica]